MNPFCFITLMFFPWFVFSRSKPTFYDKQPVISESSGNNTDPWLIIKIKLYVI
jgi:hypothetical protein